MVRVNFISDDAAGDFETDSSLLEIAESLGIEIESLCGGEGKCGKCKVVIEKGENNLNPLTNSEKNLMSNQEIEDNFRLACEAKIKSGEIDVRVPDLSRREKQIILTSGLEVDFERNPSVEKYHLQVPKPSLEDFVADYERVKKSLKDSYDVSIDDIDNFLQRDLPSLLREKEGKGDLFDLTAVLWEDEEIIDLEPGWKGDFYGLAVDLGTTTIVGYLVNLETGEIEEVESILNPQVDFGEDLMTRISFVSRHENGRTKVKEKAVDGVNKIMEKIEKKAGIDGDDIYEALMVGNTAMHHLFLKIEPRNLSMSPFVPGRQSALKTKARDVGLNMNQRGYVYWLPINGGWVGADNVAVLLTSKIYEKEEITLTIDIGTNGEVAVGNKENTLVTSTAAGPAFEGASIEHGMRARAGSIEKVRINSENMKPTFETINNKPPIGICGSGIVDAAAEMLKAGIIRRDGRFGKGTVERSERIRKNDENILEYVLVWEEESETNSDITITQKDVREIQKTKGAIQAASRVLMDKLDVDKVNEVLLAGAFGNYIDKESAMTIGLFPECDLDKVKSIGNAAGEGAKLALLDKEMKKEADEVPEIVKFVEIAGTDEFENNFMETMYLPHQDISLYPRVEEMLPKDID